MTEYTREETITLVAKNPAMVALFLSRALGEGAIAVELGHIAPFDLTVAIMGAGKFIAMFMRNEAHEVESYRRFIAEMIDTGAIEVTGEIGRISDPATPQRPRTVN